ncbi:MAG: (Fe-S)-binding protein [Chloroflexi bacterium]|nr:(Fe-S)-binding protein [Chloroflexota bacterium]
MLTSFEKLIFILMVAVFGGLTAWGFYQIYRIIRRGRPAARFTHVIPQTVKALLEVGLQKPMYKSRPILTTFHALIFFGFSYYILVNVNDLLEGFLPGYSTAEVSAGIIGLLNLLGDVLSIGVLVGVAAFLVRRFIAKDKRLEYNKDVLLLPGVAQGGIKRDSLIVGLFILCHVGSRFTGQALRLAEMGATNPAQPFAGALSLLLRALPPSAFAPAIHASWWIAIGLIVVFLPYFIISKHVHIMAAPLNLALAKQAERGRLDPATSPTNGQGQALPLPGAATLADLAWPRLMDAYACIMCNRCQDVCPAHNSMRPLSPSALEINKRYWLNANFNAFAGGASSPPLTEWAISPEAVWACTTCYACVRVCPVGNEPMADIIDLRRRLVNDGAELDSGVQSTLEKIGKTGNSFGQAARNRAKWAASLDFKIKDVRKEPAEFLWFVGDYASFDARVQEITRTVARVLKSAGVDFGILYEAEKNSGNDVRRVGEEGLFEQLAEQNVAAMSKCTFERVITTDPHTLNALKNEYPDYGGKWETIHYTRLLAQLIDAGKLQLQHKLSHYRVTFHDPCYLGRYNNGFNPPRALIRAAGCEFVEMPRNKENSYCCGAGGGQIWMGSTPVGERPAENRIREALAALDPSADGAGGNAKRLLFVVSCPKDVVMYSDAVKTTGNEGKIEVRDIIQLIAEAMGEGRLLTSNHKPQNAIPA